MRRTLLIDSDIVAYKFAAVTEGVFYFDGKENPPAVDADLDESIKSADAYIEELREKLGADEVILCLTDRGNEFRKKLWPAYKAHRIQRKPENLLKVLDHFHSKYKSYLRPGLEADDCMGILATHPTLIKGEKIIVSEDKDMQCVPALLFNPAKDKEPRKISRLAADRFHLWQTIVGDTSDGYPGARGVGPQSPEAQGVLSARSVEAAWQHVLAAFRRSYEKRLKRSTVNTPDSGVTAEALLQARLARILRASDWLFSEKRPRLWRPPLTS